MAKVMGTSAWVRPQFPAMAMAASILRRQSFRLPSSLPQPTWSLSPLPPKLTSLGKSPRTVRMSSIDRRRRREAPWNSSFPNQNQQNFLSVAPAAVNFNSHVGRGFRVTAAGSVHADQSSLQDKSLAADADMHSQKLTIMDLCSGTVPQHLLEKIEELGFKYPTQTQEEALPVLMAGKDCLLHAQTGSGKTLAYMLPVLTKLSPRASVQAIIVVPTRELGMQVARVARALMGRSSKANESEIDKPKGSLSVMTLLDGGSASRQKKWIKAAPPQLIVGTLGCISRLIDSHHLKTGTVETLVVDEVDTMLGAAKEGNLLQNLLTVHTRAEQRQTIFASATVPQHHRFLRDCLQNKWAKGDLVHVHVSPKVAMPEYLQHRYVVCEKEEKLQVLVSVLNIDNPRAAIVFVNESEKAKRSGEPPRTSTTAEFLSEMIRQKILGKDDDSDHWEPLILEEDDHINQRTSTLSDFREGRRLLVATDLAARGLDLPEVSHIYNVDLPVDLTAYIHRAGRTGRRPIEEEQGTVTSFIIRNELFVLERIQNEAHSKFMPLQIGN